MDQINSLKEIDATARYELASRLQGMPRHTKLCHWDFNPSNVIVAPDGKLWVIDWAHACTGQRFGRCCHDLPAVCAGKQRAGGAVHPTVLQKGRHRQTVCQPLVADCCRSTATKKKEQEKEILMRWIDVIEYQ